MTLLVHLVAALVALAWIALWCVVLAFAASLPFAAFWGAFRCWGRLFGY